MNILWRWSRYILNRLSSCKQAHSSKRINYSIENESKRYKDEYKIGPSSSYIVFSPNKISSPRFHLFSIAEHQIPCSNQQKRINNIYDNIKHNYCDLGSKSFTLSRSWEVESESVWEEFQNWGISGMILSIRFGRVTAIK